MRATIKTDAESFDVVYRQEFDAWEAIAALDGDGPPEAASRFDSEDERKWSHATLKQARDYVRRGWEAGVASVDGRTPILGEGEVPAWEYGLAEEGSEVDVATWLSGEPACMGDMRTVPSQRPLVRIAVDMSVHHKIKASKMLRVGRSVLMCVERLRAAGFPTAVDVVFSTYGVQPQMVKNRQGRMVSAADYYKRSYTIVHVQEAGTPIIGSLLAFWCAHPASLRRAMFALVEQLPWSTRCALGFRLAWGYGSTMSASALRDEYDEWAPSAESEDDVIDRWVADVMNRRLA